MLGRHGALMPLFILFAVLHGLSLYALVAAQGRLLALAAQAAQGGPADTSYMIAVALTAMAAVAASGFLPVGIGWVEGRTAKRLRRDMTRARLLASGTTELGDSDVFTRISDDLQRSMETIGNYADMRYFNPMISGAASLLAIGAANWRIALFCLGFAVITYPPLKALRARGASYQAGIQSGKSRTVAAYSDIIGGRQEIRLFGVRDWASGRVRLRAGEIRRDQKGYAAVTWLRLELFTLTYLLSMVGILLIGGLLAARGRVTLPQVLAVLPLSGQVMQMVQGAGAFHAFISERGVQISRVREVLDAPRETPAKVRPPRPEGQGIGMSGVCFSYDGTHDALHDIDIDIPAGSSCALVGPSGCGKSTLLGVIAGFNIPYSGHVCIGGETDPDPVERRADIAYMAQDGGMLDVSIEENVAFGREWVDDDGVRRGLELGGAAGFVSELPDGLEHKCGEGGSGLSGGQRQRLSAARAMACHYPILLLDEPSSALDAASQLTLRQSIESLHGQTTVVMVSHRLEMSAGCDIIYVMDGGRIVERGSHQELLDAGGLYAALWGAAER